MRSRSLAALGAAAGLAAGCGGTASPTLVALRAQATQVCTGAGKRLAHIPTPGAEAGGEAFLARGVAALRPELVELRQLSAPADAAVVYRAALSALTGELGALNAAVASLRRQQDPVIVFRTLQQRLGPLEKQADDAWQALQIPACREH